jgi:N-dimethylarginine dimethylaminohydrolase
MLPQPHILMCPPDHYGIEYEINPWMDTERQADHALAALQWNGLRSLIEAAGARVSLIEPVAGLPDLVFTANAAMIFGNKALLSRFRYRQRQGEEPYNRRWLAEHGFEIVDVPEHFSFEGAGDALFCGDTLFAGYRMRSDAAGHQAIGRMLGVRVIPVELIDARYYHLDTCFCPLAPGEAIWYPPAFDEYGQRAIRESVGQASRLPAQATPGKRNVPLIEVVPAEAERFACNAVVIGRRVITNVGCDKLHAALRERGYEPIAAPLDEFVKAGGSAKCLTLRLDGEEAASWRGG